MILHKLRILIVLCSCLANVYAQDIESEAFKSFADVKDTLTFNNKIGDIQNGLVDKKIKITIEEIDALIQLATALKTTEGLAIAYRAKGELHKRKLDYDAAIKSFEQAIAYYKQVNKENGIARTYNDMFVVEYIKGNMEKGVSYLLESKKHFERINDSLNLAFLHNNLAAVYWSLNDYKGAEQAFLQSLRLQENADNFKIRGTIMSNLANIYIRQKEYIKAQNMVRKAIEFNKQNNKIESLALSYSTLAIIYMEFGEYKNARVYSDSTMYLLKDNPNDITYLKAKQRLGKIALLEGEFEKADDLLADTRFTFSKMDSKKNLLENYKLSSILDSSRGNLLGALAWQKQYRKIADLRSSELSTKEIENIEARFEKELAQLKKIKEQEQKERASKKELFKYRIFDYVILGILGASLIFLFSVIKVRKERKRLIEGLHESNQIKNKLFSIISHDLKNEIHGLEASLNLMKDNQLTVEEFQEIIPILAQRTNQTSILLNNLLNWSKSQMNELSAKPVHFDVTEVIAAKFTFFKPKASQKNIELINKLGSAPIFADKDMVGIVAQNLIANAIKFCESGDSISLFSREKDNYLEIGFQDTGIGIDPANLKRLFAEETFTTRGTQNETGTGLGLRICKELIELNHGNIKVESKLGEGTTFYIALPKAAA